MQQIAHHVEREDISAQVHHADVSGRSGSIARTARSTGHEPNLIQYESGTHLMSIADGDDEDLMGMENCQLEQAPFSLSLEVHVLQVARGDPGAVHRPARRHAVYR